MREMTKSVSSTGGQYDSTSETRGRRFRVCSSQPRNCSKCDVDGESKQQDRTGLVTRCLMGARKDKDARRCWQFEDGNGRGIKGKEDVKSAAP